MRTNIYLSTQSKRALILIGALHIVLLVVVLASNGIFISSRDRAPAIIVWLCISLSAYAAFRLVWLLIYGRGLPQNVFRMKMFQLVPAISLAMVGSLLIFLVLKSGNTGIGPFELGISPRYDETVVLLTSWLALSCVAFSLTSIKAARRAVNTDSGPLNGSLEILHRPYFSSKEISKEREFVATELADRALDLQKRSGYLLISVFVMVFGAAVLIVFAGQITTLDVSGIKLLALAQADVKAAEDELSRVLAEISRTRQLRSQRAKDQAGKPDERFDAVTPEDDRLADEAAQLKLGAKKAALSKANDVLLRVKDKQFDDGRSKDQASNQLLLIQTSVTRFGVVLIVIFLVQILVSLYRYNMRLAAFYSSRCDALLLSKQVVGLRETVDIMSPHDLDFWKPPKTPADEAKALLEGWLSKAKNGVKSGSKAVSDGKRKRISRARTA